MSRFNPSQFSFAGGEASPRLAGRPDTDFYKKALALCRNAIPLPHGPLLMRAGSKDTGVSGAERLIPFNVSGGEPFGLVLTNLSMKVRDYRGAAVFIYANLVTNGTFDGGQQGWAGLTTFQWNLGGFMRSVGPPGTEEFYATVAWVQDHTYTVRIRGRGDGTLQVRAWRRGATPFDYALDQTFTLTAIWQTFSVTFSASGAPGSGYDGALWVRPTGTGTLWDFDEVFVTDDGVAAADHLVAPWTTAQLARVQFDQDLTHNRMMLVHPNVAPQLLTLNVHGLWEMKAATLTGGPTNWSNTNWPAVIDWGFQGRLWLGASPDEPNTVNGSKSGYPFDFTTGVTAADGWNFNASVRGAIRWLQGQKSLLLGAERAEQAASGGGAVVWPANVNVEDESAFGSAAIQAAHLGDEVVFVARNRSEVRALSFDARTKNGWVSRALSFVAEHLVHGVKELHYAATPEPMLILVQDDGTLAACVYNRAEDVTAWWRVELGALVGSAAVVETTVGCELWAAVTRGTDVRVEIMPLHEVGVGYLDSSRHVTIGPKASGGEWQMPHAPAAGDTLNINPGSLPMTSWAPGTTFIMASPTGFFIDIPTMTFSSGMDIVFAGGGRLNVVATAAQYNATVKVIEEPSAAVKATLGGGGSIPGGSGGWTWSIPTTMSGLDRLEGRTVRVIIDGSLAVDQVVTGGTIPLTPAVTASVTVGLPFRATAKQLPLEGGLQTGSSQSAKRRRTKVRLRLNQSAMPLVNGLRVPAASPTTLVTGDVDCNVLGWEEDGALTIEQDLPFRTEILAIFGHAQVNEV